MKLTLSFELEDAHRIRRALDDAADMEGNEREKFQLEYLRDLVDIALDAVEHFGEAPNAAESN